MRCCSQTLLLALALTSCTACCVAVAGESADDGRKEALPPEFQGVELVEHLDAQLPLDLEFADENGTKVTLGSYFSPDRPVLLVLVYFGCPMLCGVVINGMVESMKAVPLTPGKDYECVVVSFDPLEGPGLAARKKESFLQAYERPAAGAGIHFLTGEKPNIAKLAATIGFGYKWVEQDRMYAHPASLYVCTPAGRISQYLKGVSYDPAALRLSLVEASHGKIGTVSDQLAMFCFQYDPSKGKYSLSALKLMRIAGGLTVMAIIVGLLVLRSLRRRKLAGEPAR